MKKLLFGVMVLLATTGMAMAGTVSFGIPAVTEALGGDTVVIPISAVGDGALQGLNLVLQVDAPLEIVALPLAGGFASNNTGWAPLLFNNGGSPAPQWAMGGTTTVSGTVAVGALANVSVLIPAGTPQGDYILKTEIDGFGASDFAGSTGVAVGQQGAGIIRVIPEPATALLLLGALPFLRRRSA